MLKYSVINLLGTFAVLALSFFFLIRAAVPTPAQARPTRAPTRASKPANAVVIQALPPDSIIIEALPAND